MTDKNPIRILVVIPLIMLSILDFGLIVFVALFWNELDLLPLPFAPAPPSSGAEPNVSTRDLYFIFIVLLTFVVGYGVIKTRQLVKEGKL